MREKTDYENRKSLTRLLNSGQKPIEVVQKLCKPHGWMYKWQSHQITFG